MLATKPPAVDPFAPSPLLPARGIKLRPRQESKLSTAPDRS